MSKTPSTPAPSKGLWFFRAWLAAVAVFLLWSGWFIYSGPDMGNRVTAGTPPVNAIADRGTILEGFPGWGEKAVPSLSFNATQKYVLVGAGSQGFYQSDVDDRVWSISHPTPRIHAQLIQRGPEFPQRITSGVTLDWELEARAGLADPSARRQGEMQLVGDSHFEAEIPVIAAGVDGEIDPYPVVTIRARDGQGSLLAETAAVLAVSPGFGCYHCHENAGTGILEVHDRHSGTNFKEMHAEGSVIDCRACHVGLTDEAGSNKGKEQGAGRQSVSAAIHGWHAVFLSDMGSEACMTCHISLGAVHNGEKNAIKPLFARDFHIDRGLNCVRCHGFMEDHALALLKAEQEGGNADAATAMAALSPRAVPLEEIQPRFPWKQEPDCTGCHDFTKKPDLMAASAFNKWSELDGGQPGLFSARRDNMLMLRCISCHGAPHAVYPARNPLAEELDNMPPLQYQEQAAPLGAYGNCALCHGMSKSYSAHHPLVERSSTTVYLPKGVNRAMPLAVFSHEAHIQQVACVTCHHTGRQDGKSMLCASSGCHDSLNAMLPTQKGEEARPDPKYFYNSFHGEQLPGCLACHTQSLEAGVPAGPTDCKACHQAPSSRWSEEAEDKGT